MILSLFSTPDLTTRVLLIDNGAPLYQKEFSCPPELPSEQLTRSGVVLVALNKSLPAVSAILRRNRVDKLTIEVQSNALLNMLWWGAKYDRYNSLLKPLLAKSLSTLPCSVEVVLKKSTRARKPFEGASQGNEEELLSLGLAFAGM